MNNELYPLVVAGDRKAMDLMAELNLPLCGWLVNKHMRKCGLYGFHMREKLFSDASFALWQAILNLVGNPHPRPNVSAYVATAIRRALNKGAKKTRERTNNMKAIKAALDYDPDPDFDEALAHAMEESGIDPEIVAMRIRGLKDAAIAEKLKMSRRTVNNERKKLKGFLDAA